MTTPQNCEDVSGETPNRKPEAPVTTETGGYRDEGAAQTGGYRDEGGRKPETTVTTPPGGFLVGGPLGAFSGPSKAFQCGLGGLQLNSKRASRGHPNYEIYGKV